MTNPPNPAIRPAVLIFVGLFPKNINANMATHNGIVEFIRAETPEDKY